MSLSLAARPCDQTPSAIHCRADAAVQAAERAIANAKPRPRPEHYAALKSALDAAYRSYMHSRFGTASEPYEVDGVRSRLN